MTQTRREFLLTVGSAAAGLACARPVAAIGGAAAPSRAPLERIGIQLYTLRREAARDLPGTLAGLARIGYAEIEFAGYYGTPATQVRDLLAASGLRAPSAHIGLAELERDPTQPFADARTIGHRWITVPSLPSGPKATVDDWKGIAARFNAAGKRVKEAGFRFAFHNHNAEFRKIGDVVPFEVLLAETDPAVVSFQLDIHWAVAGGASPIDLFERHPTRFSMVHVKDSGGPPDHRQTDVGSGTIDFRTILARARAIGVEHYFVEHDQPADPMAFARASHAYLSTLPL